MKPVAEILDLYRTRKLLYEPLHAKMRVIQNIYNGTAEIPLPDIERVEMPSVPNLLAQGVDQMASRITSVTPQVQFSSMKPGIRRYDRRASDASRVVTGWWESDKLMMKMKQRGRRLIAYGMSPVVVRWDFEEHRPTWQVRHPLETFPSTDLEPGCVTPTDCIFQFQRSVAWLNINGYGTQVARLVDGYNEVKHDAQVTVIEYIDHEETVLIATGYYPDTTFYGDRTNGLKGIELERFENFGDDIPVVIPTRLTLDAMTGQFDNMIGMYYMQAKLMALETIAVEKGIFPDTYLVSRQGEMGRFIDGPWDGRTGKVNIIAGGDIKDVQSQPGYMSTQTIDRLERAQRVTAGIPAEFGGESGSNIRTGRRGDAVLSAVIDYPVAEAQETFAFALEEENEVAIALAKRLDGSASRTIFVGTGNARRPVTYVANDTFEIDEHVVSYPASGTDMNQLIIGLGQRVGLGIMSKGTAATLDPFIDNPELEHDQIISEGLEQALVTGLQQQASTGAIPPLTLAKIMELVRNDKMELAEAMNKVTEDALKEQQAQQDGQPPTTPDQAAAPGTVAAMAGGVPDPAQTMPGMKTLGDMLGQTRRPAMTVQPMRGAARGAM